MSQRQLTDRTRRPCIVSDSCPRLSHLLVLATRPPRTWVVLHWLVSCDFCVSSRPRSRPLTQLPGSVVSTPVEAGFVPSMRRNQEPFKKSRPIRYVTYQVSLVMLAMNQVSNPFPQHHCKLFGPYRHTSLNTRLPLGFPSERSPSCVYSSMPWLWVVSQEANE